MLLFSPLRVSAAYRPHWQPLASLSAADLTLTSAPGGLPIGVDVAMGADIFDGFYLNGEFSADGVTNVGGTPGGRYTTVTQSFRHQLTPSEHESGTVDLTGEFTDPSGEYFFHAWWERQDGAVGPVGTAIHDTVTSVNAFSFTDQPNVAPSTLTQSDDVTFSGIGSNFTCTVSAGEYSTDSGANWHPAATFTAALGSKCRVRIMSSASYSTPANVVVTANGTSDTFTVTTQAAPGSITLVGSKTFAYTNANGGDTISLTDLTGGIDTKPSAGDLVVINLVGASAFGSGTDLTPSMTISGYTAEASKFSNDSAATSQVVQGKFMGGTPDTSFVTPSVATSSFCGTVHVFRNVNATAMDVTPTTASGINGASCNPPSITPITSGSIVLACYAAASASYDIAAPGGLTDYVHVKSATRSIAAAGYSLWTSGAFDPAVATATTINTNDSWTGITLALRKA